MPFTSSHQVHGPTGTAGQFPIGNIGDSARVREERIECLKESLFDLDLETLLENTASDNIFVWLPSKTPSSNRGDDKLESIEIDDPSAALKLYNEVGASLYFR